MKKLIISTIFLTLLALPFATAQTASEGTPSNDQGITAASSSLRILSPTVGEKIGNTTVNLRYELTNSGASAAPSPTYRVQLDGRDPAETLDTEYTFNGLKPGPHTIVVELVDANHTPIGGSRTVVHFNTFTPGAAESNAPGSATTPGTKTPPPTSATPGAGANQQNTTPHQSSALAPPPIVKAKMPLPTASGELPLLSMVGFGVLVGGVISAMRTRKP